MLSADHGLIVVHADQELIGAVNPMLCPIRGCRPPGALCQARADATVIQRPRVARARRCRGLDPHPFPAGPAAGAVPGHARHLDGL